MRRELGYFVTGCRRPGSTRTAFPTRTRAVVGMGRSRYVVFVLAWASDEVASVSTSRDPFGTTSIWLGRLIATLRSPFRVGTPPEPTSSCPPFGVRAVTTATSRDQPPLAAIDTFTCGVPKSSIADRSGADLRTQRRFGANVVTPGKATDVVRTCGSVGRRTIVPG